MLHSRYHWHCSTNLRSYLLFFLATAPFAFGFSFCASFFAATVLPAFFVSAPFFSGSATFFFSGSFPFFFSGSSFFLSDAFGLSFLSFSFLSSLSFFFGSPM